MGVGPEPRLISRISFGVIISPIGVRPFFPLLMPLSSCSFVCFMKCPPEFLPIRKTPHALPLIGRALALMCPRNAETSARQMPYWPSENERRPLVIDRVRRIGDVPRSTNRAFQNRYCHL